MACVLHPGAEPAASGVLAVARGFRRGAPPAMTRCECADVSFQEIAGEMAGGSAFEEAARRTGCGQTCTACLPDLRRFLSSL